MPIRFRLVPVFALVSSLALLLTQPSWGQVDPDYVLSVSDANGAQGGSVEVDVAVDIFGTEIQGWSFGVCHDPSQLDLTSAVDSPLTLTIKNGSHPTSTAWMCSATALPKR